jgi:hypothetical protein
MLGKSGASNPTYPFIASTNTQSLTIGSNSYWDGTNWKAAFDGPAVTAAQQRINYNEISWHVAGAVTQGTTQSFTQAMTLDASGNLLLGGTSTTQLDGVFGQIIGSSSKTTAGIALETSAGAYMMYTDSTDSLIFWDSGSNAERARIDSSGNLLVGTTSAVTSAPAKIGILYAGASQFGIGIKTSDNSGSAIYFVNSSGTGVGNIALTSTNTAYNTSSDYRLKNTIAPMTGALAKVALLKPCTYKWNVDGSDGEGFIAHELAEIMPNAVTGDKDAVDAEGNPKYQGIDTSFLVATLTAAIQELKAEFDAYKASHP